MKPISTLFVLSAIAAYSCQVKQSSMELFISYDTSLAQVVTGSWEGELPCADCSGMKYFLTLHDDGRYREESVYKDNSPELFISEGTWKLKADSTMVLIDGDKMHKVFKYLPGGLIMLSLGDNKTSSSLAERYILTRDASNEQPQDNQQEEPVATDRLLSSTWILIEINGRKIDLLNSAVKRPQFSLQPKENTVLGYGGCNQFSGSFKIRNTEIHFSAFTATKMACDHLHTENDFLGALSSASFSYQLVNDHLILSNIENNLQFKSK